jgi:hypothetical protein
MLPRSVKEPVERWSTDQNIKAEKMCRSTEIRVFTTQTQPLTPGQMAVRYVNVECTAYIWESWPDSNFGLIPIVDDDTIRGMRCDSVGILGEVYHGDETNVLNVMQSKK